MLRDANDIRNCGSPTAVATYRGFRTITESPARSSRLFLASPSAKDGAKPIGPVRILSDVLELPPLSRRLALGFAALPFVAAAATFVLYPWLYAPDSPLQIRVLFAHAAMLLAIPIAFVGAWPVYFAIGHRHLSFWTYLCCGAALGSVPGALLAVIVAIRSAIGYPTERLLAFVTPGVALGTLVGSACGVVFWIIVGRSQITTRPARNSV